MFSLKRPSLVLAGAAAIAAGSAFFVNAPVADAASAVTKSCCGAVSLAGAEIASDAALADNDNKPPAGFTAIFNGSDINGWWGVRGEVDPRKYVALTGDALAAFKAANDADVKKHWRVVNGEIVNDGRGSYLTTEKFYGDFEFLVDYNTWPRGDSGVYLRGVPQVQIWDPTNPAEKRNGADKGSGALWNNRGEGKFPLVKADNPFGTWNRLRVLMVGSRVWVWLNGKQTVAGAVLDNFYDRAKTLPVSKIGPLCLQTQGKEIRWKNIFIREIAPAEADKILAARDAAGFTPLIAGKSLDGWQGATGAVKFAGDGHIVWQRGKGGTLFTKKEFSDFKMRFDFKLPPNGNNGIAIRYPGHGDTAYSAIELQVLADDYKGIVPEQAHGSAYKLAAAARGFQRPIGEWNFQEITVQGSKIKVELNGYVILDADMAKVKKKHAGKDRKSGFLGFAGHNDPVEFRNVQVKELSQ